jgi:hypothetical protein
MQVSVVFMFFLVGGMLLVVYGIPALCLLGDSCFRRNDNEDGRGLFIHYEIHVFAGMTRKEQE